MSGLFGSLTNNVKALNAQSRAIETAGRNLANVNNPHYARQRVLFGDRGTVQTALGPQSLGLEALGITQLRDTLLDKQVLRETADGERHLIEAGLRDQPEVCDVTESGVAAQHLGQACLGPPRAPWRGTSRRSRRLCHW